MLLISFLRYFICSILIISAGSNGAISCENDSNNAPRIVSVKANQHIVYTTYEDAEGRWTETSEREAEGSAVQSWDLVFESETPEDQSPDQPLEISFLPTLQLSADNEMPLDLIQGPPPFQRTDAVSNLFTLLNNAGGEEENILFRQDDDAVSDTEISSMGESSDGTVILEEDLFAIYDPFENWMRYDLRYSYAPSYLVASSSVLNPECCKTPMVRDFVIGLGYLMDFKALLHRTYAIPSSFEGRLKTLAVLLDDSYKEEGFVDLPCRLMDLLQGDSHLTPGKTQSARCLMLLPIQYMVQKRDESWKQYQQNLRYSLNFQRERAYRLNDELMNYFFNSQDIMTYLCLYENIFFFEELNAFMPSFTKKKLMEMAWQDRVKEA